MGKEESRQKNHLSERIGHRMQKFWIALFFMMLTNFAWASCILPTPDGGRANVSNRNIAGKIVKITSKSVFINDVDLRKKVQVFLPSNATIFTAFGGDFPSDSLAVGQSARVWFKDCSAANKNRGVAAYFEIYSTDTKDVPDKTYFSKKGQ